MKNNRILLIGGVRGITRAVKRSLVSSGYEVVTCALARTALEHHLDTKLEMIVIDADGDFDELCWALERITADLPDVIVLIVSGELGNRRIVDQILDRGLNHVIAKHGGIAASQDFIDETEMIATVHKLLDRDIFGIEKYLPARGVRVHSRTLLRSDEREGVLDELGGFLTSIECYQSVQPMILTVADELMMNAIFSAPRDAEGNAKYDHLNRKEIVALQPSERVELRYACDGRNVLLSVSDPFGSLDRETIVRYVEKPFARMASPAKGGASLGLYMVSHAITQLVFNIHTGVRTEVIAAFYIRSGLRGLRISGQSLNLFIVQ